MKKTSSSPSPRPSTPEASQAAASAGGRSRYQAPAILWEQPFVALTQTSVCTFPGESELCP